MPDATLCIVCGTEADPRMAASCNWCGETFHLNQRNDVEAKDCGKVWVDEQFMALQFACDRCVAADDEPRTQPEAPGASTGERPHRLRRYKRRA